MPLSEWKINKDIAALKEGDLVLYYWSRNSEPKAMTVTRRTPTRVFVEERKFNLTGEELDRYSSGGRIAIYDEEVLNRYETARYRRQILRFLQGFKWEKLSFEEQEKLALNLGYGKPQEE